MNVRKLLFAILLTPLLLARCDTLKEIADGLNTNTLTTAEIAAGLKQALEFGIAEGAEKLAEVDGYFKSPYKILLPPEARKVTDKLQGIPGFSEVENIILEKINRGAEEAAKSAKPIFVDAIRAITFQDALGILMGEKNAATTYLHAQTYPQLYAAFHPVIVDALNQFNAIEYWADAVTFYNKIPFVDPVEPELDRYVTERALFGLFDMVEKKELKIRTDISERTTDLLRKVFAKQD